MILSLDPRPDGDKTLEEVIQQLFARLPQEQQNLASISEIEAVLYYAADILLAIHHAAGEKSEEIWKPTSVAVLYTTMDLIMLTGLIPFLSLGVGLPKKFRPKTQLTYKQPAHSVTSNDSFTQLMTRMTPLWSDRKRPVTAILRDRYLADIIALTLELTYGPLGPKDQQQKWKILLDRIILE